MNAPQSLASDGDPWLFSDGLIPPHFFYMVADVDMYVVEVKIILDIHMFLASLVITVAEVEDPQMGDQRHQPISNPTIELQGDEFWPLSKKPFFEVIIRKANVKPSYQMVIPAKFQPTLPSCSIPTVLTFGGKNWEMTYTGGSIQRKFDINWREFVNDNNLKVGDACVFELLECSSTKVVFRVQILRGDIPSELLGNLKGDTVDAPIIID
ncbi:hypothetical protein DVH24_013774 [Malus domestica]|uniref:TF-B3 domain-containing protein n=1 Tax=Malus domestica TaxID=3750 RepID=A0A498JBT7_MALDO|nr:hypothetical protein DVH24_013774 [Malus domestica]